jgi:hypothetical protein
MIKINLLAAAALLTAVASLPAQANQVPRAWVSGHGTDQIGCGAVASPCRSLQYAHDNIIEAGGEIDILDPAGYGAITITKAVSIVNDGVGTAGVQQANSSQNAITINAGASDSVTLRGLNIDGLGSGGNGIFFESGSRLTVVNCVIRHFANASSSGTSTGNAILLQPITSDVNFLISNTILSDNDLAGVMYLPSTNTTRHGVIDHVTSVNNQYGFFLLPTGGASYLVILNSIASDNGFAGLYAENTGALTATIDLSTFSNNNYGFAVGGTPIVMLGRSVITTNAVGIENNTSPNTFYSYGSNEINQNGSDIGGTALNTAYKPQ